jgi:hypothetical protein
VGGGEFPRKRLAETNEPLDGFGLVENEKNVLGLRKDFEILLPFYKIC